MVQRWTDEMLDRQAEENTRAFRELREAIGRLETQVAANTQAVAANTQAIAANTQAIAELREGQAMMMQIVMQQQTNIQELRQDTRRILDALINPPPMNGHR
ncbi:hypothetical protein GlitD10_1631 [Gloeomargarita lithophora Alchichica-D10]|uniref:Uncharacterized protein n=1 Tax=Gloeomargarita lithophora Alchichica-D10 TaxID=1188229 RepID=A0A1J0ADG8_9CYAN|nr:hypothetical protein [Gloeomargarita lithophora]APB33955.1 hypothetical protein GlitD10_1631 [Gloeomargarita lithophora Alchichica-D10]